MKFDFPGLETEEDLMSYKNTVLKNIRRGTALCAKQRNEIIGVLLFSINSQCLSFLAVHPEHRRKRIASKLIDKMLEIYPENKEISVTTFVADDKRGPAPRALYKKYGFIEGEFTEEYGCHQQKFHLHRD